MPALVLRVPERPEIVEEACPTQDRHHDPTKQRHHRAERYTVGLPNHRNSQPLLAERLSGVPLSEDEVPYLDQEDRQYADDHDDHADRIAAFSAHAAVVVCGHFGSGERDHRPDDREDDARERNDKAVED